VTSRPARPRCGRARVGAERGLCSAYGPQGRASAGPAVRSERHVPPPSAADPQSSARGAARTSASAARTRSGLASRHSRPAPRSLERRRRLPEKATAARPRGHSVVRSTPGAPRRRPGSRGSVCATNAGPAPPGSPRPEPSPPWPAPAPSRPRSRRARSRPRPRTEEAPTPRPAPPPARRAQPARAEGQGRVHPCGRVSSARATPTGSPPTRSRPPAARAPLPPGSGARGRGRW
jgi:hypothetical protein